LTRERAQAIEAEKAQYDKPFLITWLCTSAFSFYLIPPAFAHWRRKRRRASSTGSAESDVAKDAAAVYTPVAATEVLDGQPDAAAVLRAQGEAPLTVRETAHLAIAFMGVWFAAVRGSHTSDLRELSVRRTTRWRVAAQGVSGAR